MLVRAIEVGYYGDKLRYPAGAGVPGSGDPFVLKDPKDFSKRWMVVVEEAQQIPAAPVPKPEYAATDPGLEPPRPVLPKLEPVPGSLAEQARKYEETPAPVIAPAPAIHSPEEPKRKRGSGNRRVL